ncbi:MAG: DUF262 domain-containing protein [Candidatus Rokubacteria bacterium]|nr:DUF262 domain-containing protein [Candidatus Rokubacteria bacterium]
MGESKVMLYTVADLYKFYREGRIRLAPEFQRNSIWPAAARAYLIDTILNRQPIPQLFLHRTVSAQTGRTTYDVVDGQQRLRAIFDFLEDKIRLTQSHGQSFYNRRLSQLPAALKDRVWNHTLLIQELYGYSEAEIEDMFVRINRFVVRLSKQELRHAKARGQFHQLARSLAGLPFWLKHRVFSKNQIQRMRGDEFVAEIAILLIEGPQDKKKAVDLYYVQYQDHFPSKAAVERRLREYLRWIETAFPDLARHRYRKPVDLYSLVGALDAATKDGATAKTLKPQRARTALIAFEQDLASPKPSREATTYLAAASRQTDNVGPRRSRIEIIQRRLRAA